MLAVGEKTVYRLAKKGSIPAIKIKEKRCFYFSILNPWIQKKILQNFRKSQYNLLYIFLLKNIFLYFNIINIFLIKS